MIPYVTLATLAPPGGPHGRIHPHEVYESSQPREQ